MTGTLLLGSASPRRAALLRAAGLSFAVQTAAIDELALAQGHTDASDAVAEIARAKFDAFAAQAPEVRLLTADTLVACDNVTMGKPTSDDEVASMLRHLSARPLRVVTGICIGAPGAEPAVDVVTTTVDLRELMAVDIDAYVAAGAGLDKAGGLALQSEAAGFIAGVEGCWSNVVGLPMCSVMTLLAGEPTSARPARCNTDLCGEPATASSFR